MKIGEYRPLLAYAAVVSLFAADRLLKIWALALPDGTGFGFGPASFTLFRNEGIAFSIPLPPALFWPPALAILLLLAALFWKLAGSARRRPVFALMVLLMLLGALSNLFDRLAYGATIDYLLFFGRSAVNLADGMIIFGAAYLFIRRKGVWPERGRPVDALTTGR